MERQYRHAANRFLWELPAGKLEAGEDALLGAQRELEEETGYKAKKWKPLVEYYASPGFLGESMKVFVAEGLIAGEAHPEDDEQIEFRLVKLSEILEMIEKGEILDGKTLTSVLLYARKIDAKRQQISFNLFISHPASIFPLRDRFHTPVPPYLCASPPAFSVNRFGDFRVIKDITAGPSPVQRSPHLNKM